MKCRILLAALAVLLSCSCWGASTAASAKPASFSFTYQVSTIAMPAPQKLTYTLSSTDPASTVAYVSTCDYGVPPPNCPAGWLSATPASGYSPLQISVAANPTGLSPGTYVGTIYLSSSAGTGDNLTVTVTLSITNPPATLVLNPGNGTNNFTPANGATPPTLSFTYTTGTAWSSPQSKIDVASNGGIIPFTVTAAAGSGKGAAAWLRVNPLGSPTAPGLSTSGVASSGSSAPIIVSLDATTVGSLLPGSYAGSVAIAATNAVNGTITIAVNLVVSAGPPTFASLFPTAVVQAPAVDPVITINGTNFFNTSVVTAALAGPPTASGVCTQTNGTSFQLTSTVLSQSVLEATITGAKAQLAVPNSYCICISNPPGGPGQAATPACATVAYTFNVISSAAMAVAAIVNAASDQASATQVGTAADPILPKQTSIAPGEIVSIYGQNLGPMSPLAAVPGPSPAQISSSALAPSLNTSALATDLLIIVDGSTTVDVNFSADPWVIANPATAEPLANIVTYINICAQSALSVNVAAQTGGGTQITITSPTTGTASSLSIADTTAAQLLGFTIGNGNANAASGSASIAFPTLLNNTQILLQYWDYTAATPGYATVALPILMVSSNQINAMVPFEVYNAIPGTPPTPSQKHNASLTVVGASTSAPAVGNLLVVNENPGIFTLSGTGAGQGAVMNCLSSGWTINGSKNAATRGSPICLYATGLGILAANPPAANPTPIPVGFGSDESVAPASAFGISDPVGVSIGGVPAVVTYAGTSPGSIGGLTQINAIVPPTATTGAAVAVTINGGTQATARQSQTGVTIAIK